mgnify:CR=1 FL=1
MSTTTPKTPTAAAPRKTTAARKTTTTKPAVKAPVTKVTPPTPSAPVSASTATPAAATAKPAVVGQANTVVMGPVMRKKELIERVVARSGIKKKDAKPVVEAMLAELGDALAENRELALPPMGKVKVRREKTMPNGRVLVVKIRQNGTRTTPEYDAAE